MDNLRSRIDRRKIINVASAGLAAMTLAPHLALGADASAQRRNVLFIAVDDLRTELGCYGVQRVSSPNIDRLAARGILFERAYCQQALCAPSRSSLLTGCRPDTTRVYDLSTHFRKAIPNVVTLPQHFKDNGYYTQAFGKIYHGGLEDPRSWSVPTWTADKMGWYQLPENRRMVEGPVGGLKDDDEKVAAVQHVIRHGPPVECADVPDNAYADGIVADKAIAALQEARDKSSPFFLAVGFYRPHLPFAAPKKYWDLYKPEELRLASNPNPPRDYPPVAGTDWEELRKFNGMPQKGKLSDDQARTLIHGYLASVSYVDAQVGRVVGELDRLGLASNTVIVLWGDHGWKLGEHGMWCKHTNFELDTHAPLICAVPGQAGGRRCQALVEFVDVYPSLCDFCGLGKPASLEGTSFAPLLQDPARTWKTAAFSQHPHYQVMGYSMRTDRWRYTEWRKPNGSVMATELYDQQADPQENVCLAKRPEDAALIRQLAAQLQAGWKAAQPQE